MGVYDKELPEFLNADIDSILADFRSRPIPPYTPPPAPVEEDGEFVKGLKRGVEGLKSSAYGAAGVAGSILGADNMRDWGYKGFLEHEEESAKHAGRVQTLEDIKGLGDVPDYVTGTFGSLVPSMAESAVTATVGSLIGSTAGPGGTVAGGVGGFVGKQAVKSAIRKLARKYVKEGMEKKLAREAAEEAVGLLPAKKIAANLGAKAGIVAGTAPIEAGAMWGEGMQQGKDNPYSAAVFGTLSGLSELVGGEGELIDIFTNPARQAAKGNIIKRIGMEMVKTIPQEAAQEATQETLAIINRKVVDPSFDMFGEEARSRVLNSAAAGAIGGGAFGAAGGVKSKGPLTRATEAAVPPATPQPAMEPDPFQDEQPPHYSETLEQEEQQSREAAGVDANEETPGGTTAEQQQVDQDGPLSGAGMGQTDTVLSEDEQAIQQPMNEQQRSTDELLLDDARDWAAGQIKLGKTHLMRQIAEPPDSYYKRLIDSYQKRNQKPPAQPADTGPKYASVQLVNPESGGIEIVRPEEVAARLLSGWRPVEQDVSPVTRHPSPITDLNTVTEKERESLKTAMERLQYWEHSGTDGGKSNREQLYPWLSSWPTTTPAEVGKAIGRFLEGKKLGDVQQRLVEAALEYERENSVPFDIAEETTEEDAPQAQSAPAGKTPLSGTVRAKAQAYAQSAGMDLDGATDEEIAAFVNKYRAWKWAKRQEEHLTKKIEKTREPKALERLGKSLAEATSKRKELEPKGPVGGAAPITDNPSPITDVTADRKARWAEARRKHLLNKLAQEKEPRARERIRNTLVRLEAKQVPREEEAGEKGDAGKPASDIRRQRVEAFKKKYGYMEDGDAEKPASQNAPETFFEGKAISDPGQEYPAKTPTIEEERPTGAVPPASGEMSKAPSMVRDFAAKVLNGEDHPKRLVFKVTTETKRQKVINDTGVDIGGSVEMVLPDSIIHVKKRHLDITLDDWERLPEIAETFNDSYIGRAIGDPKTKRMIFVRESDPYQYVYVAEFASGGRGKRLIVKTYFKDTSKNVEDFLEKNAQKTKEAPSGVGDFTQPALRPQNSTSSVDIVANFDGNVKENQGKIDDFREKIGSVQKGRLRQAEQGQQQSEQKETVGEEKPVRFALRPGMSNKEALPGLVERGVNNYAPGMKFPDFAKKMKAELGELWERFKSMMLKVWHEVRAKFAEERGSLSREQREESLFPVDVRAEEENFRKQLNDPDSNRRSLVEVGSTPKILVRLGAQQKPLYISRTTIEKITMPEGVGKGKHNLPIDVLDGLYRNLHDPVMVLESKVENIKAFVVVTEMFVNQGGRRVPVIAAIHINEQHGRNVINRVASVYGKDSLKWFENEILERRVVYRSKQKSPSWLMTAGLQLPRVRGAMKSFTDSRILTEDDVVNPKFAVTAEAYGIPAADIQAAFEPVYRNMPKAPPWRVVQTAAELPRRALDDAAGRGMPQRFLQAVYLGNEVVYVADHFSSIEEAKQVILEEVVVHHGLRAIMPRDAYEKHMLHAALWYANKRTEDWKALAEGYGLDLKTRAGRIEAAEEMLGRDARTGKNSTMLSRIIAAVKEFLRSIGFDVGYGEAEIRELLGKARRYIEGKEAPYEKEGEGGIDYGALLRKLREQGITDEQLQAFMAYEPGGGKFAGVTVRKYPATMSADSILETLNPNVRNDGGSEIIVRNGPEKSRDMRFALALLEDVKSQIIDKSVSLNTTEREVLEAERPIALEAIAETVKDYDEPGRFLFRAFYVADQELAPGVVPYNPERGHYAAGEDLKGSWWTTSLSTAQEIAWSKARSGKRVKVVALPVDKLPNGNVYIQNTNPPGFVYDLFVGLPSDVSMKDVREMPVDGGVRYALAGDGLLRYTEQWGSAETWKSLVRLLNPLDWSRFMEWIDEHTPVHIMNTVGHVLRTPVEAAEADPNKAPLVDTALDREKNKNSLILKLLGWFGGKEKPAGFVERLTEQVTSWGNKDLSTAWGVIADNYARLSGGDKKGVNLLIYRGDIDGKAWRTYDMVQGDKKLAENLPSEAAFQAYRDIRTHIDTVVADTIEAEMRKSAAENGMSMDEVEKHIFTFRNNMARHPGWMPRNHGEGDWQVNVYQRITGLKWEIGQYRAAHHYQFLKKNGGRVDFEKSIDALSAYLPYFPGKAVADEIKTLARRFGLAYEHESGTGRQRVYVDQGAEKRLGKAIAKLKKDLSVEGLPEKKRFELQGKLTGLEDTLFFVKGNSPQKQIRFFVKQAAKIIGKLELQNSVNIRQAEEKLKQAIADKESAAEIKRLKDELQRLGDGSIKVKVYMKLQSSRSRANRHKKEVMAGLKKAMPENYLDWASYETRVDFNNRLTEATYGDMQNDFAMEQAQLQAVERAASKQDISKTQAAGIRHQIVQSLAEVLMARGAGAHRIQRAPYLIEGYDTENPIQAYQDYMTSTAGMISKAQYACAQFENFRYARPEVKPWAEQYIRDTLRNMGAADRIGANLRSVATLAYLGFKVSSMVINSTQPWTLGIAELGKHTRQNALVAIARAQKDIFRGKLSDEEKAIFSSEIWKEQEQNTVIREMAGAGEGTTGKISGFFHTLTGKALSGFQEVEMLNRKTVILAAYRSFRADGMEHAEALDKALRVNRRVNFEMSRANLPGFAQKPLGRTVYALQSFLWNNWNWVYNNLTSGKKEDMAAMLRYAAAMAIIGGAAALPGWDELDKLYQTLFGESPRLAFRKWTKQHARQYGALGEMVNGFAWHGLASATGVNISNAMRLQIPIVSPLLSGDSLPEAAGGVFTGLAQKGGRAVTAASRGDWYRALENISPEALAGGMRAYRMSTKGATTGTGKVIFDENGRPMKYGTGEAAVRMLGFQPSRIAERNDLTNVEKGLSAHWREQRGDLLAELRLSKPGQRKEVMLKIMKFNRRLRTSQANGLVPAIKTAAIRRTLSDRPNKGKAEWQREQLSG
jgi:hypothetical protein